MAVQQASLFFDEPPEQPRQDQPAPVAKTTPAVDDETPIAAEKEVPLVAEPVQTEIPTLEVDEEIREIELPVVDEAPKETKPIKRSGKGRMRLSDMQMTADLVEVPEDEILFQKSYYGISEVSKMFKVNVSLIRFWENEFDILKPKKNGKGDRLFRPQDIKNLQLIFHLLREKKYTIVGARDFLKKNKKAEETIELIEALKKTKAFLLDLKANL